MKTFPIAIFLTLAISSQCFAETPQSELTSMKQDLAALLQRVERLEAENLHLRKQTETLAIEARAPEAEANKKPAWTDTIAITGDLRYRYESTDAETSNKRERNRVRARVAIKAKPSDNLEVGVGLASGGNDPVSTNQTLGAGGSTKDIRLDLAYATWQATPGLSLTAGKMKNPWYKAGGNELLWDGDLNPEGLALRYRHDGIFINGLASFLESDTRRGSETIVYGVQGGIATDLGEGRLTAGLGYLDTGVEGKGVFYGDDDDFFGNSFTCSVPGVASTCYYTRDYNMLEVFAEYGLSVGELPLSLFAEYVQNRDADRFDTGWVSGFKLGKARQANTWEVSYLYQDLEADAVLGLTTGSDFGGGGTDTTGHLVKGTWAVSPKWNLSLSWFANSRGDNLGTEKDYDRLQLDTAFKF